MKRTFFLIAVLAIFVGFTSCEKDDDESTSSKVEITVKNSSGSIQANTTVYMFTDPSNETFGNKPIYAKRSAVTNSNGIANFELQVVTDLDAVNSQTTLYFTVLNKISSNSYSVKGSVGLTVTKGQNSSTILRLNN